VRWIVLLACLASLQAGAHDADLTEARNYRNGTGVAVDKARAVRLFQLAAEAGDADAAFTLANMQDRVAAQRWLQRAADGESPEALQELAMAEPDPARAAQLMKQSAHALTHRVR
jgi:TPR repeat protein